MEFRILGPLEALENGQRLDLGGRKQRAVLVVLLLNANEAVSSSRLIDALWPEHPPETAAKALQVYVSRLRKVLGKERVQTKASGYALVVGEDELDSSRCRRLVAEGRAADALELWRGASLSDFASEAFAQAEIAQLEELRLSCLEERIGHDLSRGAHVQLIGELEAFVTDYPLRERPRELLMLALYRSGRQAEALDVYLGARAALVDELGIEPSRRLRQLHQAILNQDPGLELIVHSPAGGAGAGRLSLVGRSSELAELESGLDDAFAGRGRLFLLVGEPGIGKSRLADDLAGLARARGAQVLVGRCWEAGGAPAYWPWVQSIRMHLQDAPEQVGRGLGVRGAELVQLLPELHEYFPDFEHPALESDSARFRLFEAVAGFFTEASRARPIVLILDDLHAADEPSLLLLQFLARELGVRRMLVLGAYRDVDPTPSHPLTETVAQLAREPVTRTLPLRGLDEQDVASFIELVAGEAPDGNLVSAIYEDTDGNPLFVGEIVRLLVAEGRLRDGGHAPNDIPQSIRDVIASRLARLSSDCNQTLVLASVLGREFGIQTLELMAGLSPESLLDALDEAMQARVITDLPGAIGRVRFAHVLIRNTLYDGLTTARRVRLHRMVVDALETAHTAAAAELAHHAIAGSDFDRGFRYASEAGDRALGQLAYEEAVRLYQTALDALALCSPADDSARCRLLLSLGEAELSAGDGPGSRATFLEAAELARQLGLSAELAQAAAGYGGRIVFARAGDDALLVPLLEEALAALTDDQAALKVRLLARLAGALRDEHSRERRTALSAEAVKLARTIGDPAALGYALVGHGAAITAPDAIDEQLAVSRELLNVAGALGDLERLQQGYVHALHANIQLGDVAAARGALDAARRIADELGQPAHLWEVAGQEAMLTTALGDLDEAAAQVEEALTIGERAQAGMAVPVYWGQRYALCELRGNIDDEVARAVTELARTQIARPMFRCLLAHMEAKRGRPQKAKEAFAALAADDFAALPFDIEWLFAMSFLAETSVLLEDEDAAAVLYRQLLPWKHLNVVDIAEGMRGSVSLYLGQLALFLGNIDDATEHLESAITMNAQMGARPWLARAQHTLAHALDTHRGPDDGNRAEALAADARSTFDELRMPYGQCWQSGRSPS